MIKDNNENFNLYKIPLLDDLLENKFDTTWHKNLNKKQKYFTLIEPEFSFTEDDGLVAYSYNEECFRSDEFTTKHDGLHILFGGCSETEGVGGNIEDAWSHMLYSKISQEKKCSGFFNLAKSGWGWNRIIINSLIYFNKYGTPDYYFILLPNNQRKFFFYENADSLTEKWKYNQKYPSYYTNKSDKLSELNSSGPAEYQQDFITFLISWKLFANFCENKNIKLFFACWDHQDSINIKRIELFNNYIHIDYSGIMDHTKKYYSNKPKKKDDLVKRDGHNGRVMHDFWCNLFYEKYKGVDNNF